jgi:hypothetical protein
MSRVLTNYPAPMFKQVRLQAARGRMLMDGMVAASAAFDIRTLRSPGTPLLESVGNR